MITYLDIPPEVYEDHIEYLWPIFVLARQIAKMKIVPKDELDEALIKKFHKALKSYDKIWGNNEPMEESVQ